MTAEYVGTLEGWQRPRTRIQCKAESNAMLSKVTEWRQEDTVAYTIQKGHTHRHTGAANLP